MLSSALAAATQSEAILNAVMQTGAYGLICAWLMWRDNKQQERFHAQEERRERQQEQQEERREKRHEETQHEIRMQRQSIDDLVRLMGLEVLSRPDVQRRAAQDAQAIVEAVKARNAG